MSKKQRKLNCVLMFEEFHMKTPMSIFLCMFQSQQVSDVSSVCLPVLLRRPRPSAQLDNGDDVVRSKISKPRNAFKVKSAKQLDTFTDDNLMVSPRCELQSPVGVDPLRPKSPVVVKSDKLPAHHTSLQDLSSLNNSRSLVKPLKVRGPDPLPARPVKKNPVLLHTSLDEDAEQYCREPPLFTLTDFIVQYSASENVSVDNVHKALCSRYTYDRLQQILLETVQSKSTKLSVQDLKVPDCASVGPQRIPQRQILVEMALALKEQLSQVRYSLLLNMSLFVWCHLLATVLRYGTSRTRDWTVMSCFHQ